MGKLTSKQVLHVAKLAKLNLTSEEIEKFAKQLSKVLDYMSELSEVDTKNVQATSQTNGLTNVFREDEIDVTRYLPQDGFFEVEAVIKK